MRFSAVVAVLAGLSSALPTSPDARELVVRDDSQSDIVEQDLEARAQYGVVRWAGPGVSFIAVINDSNEGRSIPNGAHRPKINVVEVTGNMRCTITVKGSYTQHFRLVGGGSRVFGEMVQAIGFQCLKY